VAGFAASDPIQNIISFPPQIHRGHHYVPKQALLFTANGVIHILASIWPNQIPEITYLRGKDLMYMKVTLILLYGFLEIVALGISTPTRLEMEFNTVAWDRISRPVRQLLQAAKTTPANSIEKASFSPAMQKAVGNLPLKFFNGVRIYGLLPGEDLEELVFQPSVWERRLLLFRRVVLANILLMLTSNYMVIIQEELEVSQGWILTYIPRKSMVTIQNQPSSQWNELTVNLRKGKQTTNCKFLLTTEAVQSWRIYWIQHGGQWQDLPSKSG
jgi:hypothetical protein